MAKKQTKKKAKRATGTARGTKLIRYLCDGRVCVADPMWPHSIGRGRVDLEAVNTDVRISFLTMKGSPFKSGKLRIDIPAGTTHREVVRLTALGGYIYALSCSDCKTREKPLAPPEMIVP